MTNRAQRSLRTGDLLSLGVSPDELRGPRWRQPFHGVHAPVVDDEDHPLQRIQDAAALVPPGGALAGWAAGHQLGAHDLDGRGRSGHDQERIMIVVPLSCHPAPRPGIQFVRSALGDGDLVEIDGIRVTAAVRTCFDVARSSSVEEGLVGADIICRQVGLEPADVQEYAEQHPRMRGLPVARAVLALADRRSRSSGESRLRYIWVVQAGLPRPQCNPYVLDGTGDVVAMTDLLDLETGLAGEYDGAEHRSLRQHTADNAREEDLEGLGIEVVRATSLDVGPLRDRTVARILAGRGRAAGQVRSWGWRPSPIPRPVAANSRPVAANSRPVAANSRPVAADSRPVAANSRPAAADSRPAAADSRPAAADSRPVAANW
jgi:hypothetical protein